MDKIKARNNITLLIIVCLLLALSAGVAFSSETALAAGSAVTAESVTCVVGYDIIDGAVSHVYGDYSGGYAKDITVRFRFVGATLAKINSEVDGLFSEGSMTPVPQDGILEYRITQNGIIKLTAVAYDGHNELDSVSLTVRSDNEAPEVPQAEGMDSYRGEGQRYTVDIDADLPNVFEVKYLYRGELFSVSKGGAVALELDGNATVTVYYFDGAYNCTIREYVFDKFDTTPPPKPEITAVPNVDISQSGGYASSYAITVDYGVDPQSGIAFRRYSVNGQAFEDYAGTFYLDKEASYVIKAFSVDAVGNVSETEELVLTDRIDATAPFVASADITYDLTAEKIATVRLEVRDSASGPDYAKIVGSDIYFTKVLNGIFELKYDCYGVSSLDLEIYDRAGNFTTTHIIFNYFGDPRISRETKKFADWFKTASPDEYTEKSFEEIKSELSELNVLLASATTSSANFTDCFKRLDDLIAGKSTFFYRQETPTEYLSGLLTFDVNQDDFAGFLKGDEIKLVYNAAKVENGFAAESGFKKSFSEGFSLKILYNGSDAGALENGIKVALNMPVGFYEREYVLFDAETGEKLDIECINNKIEFTLKKSSTLTLVISGENTPVGQEPEVKGIPVFGRKISYGAFFGVLGGGIGFLAGAIIVIIILSKRGKKE